MVNTSKKVIPYDEYKRLAELFQEAVSHLEYCGYGDEWERECADTDKLPKRLHEMSKRVEKIIELNGE